MAGTFMRALFPTILLRLSVLISCKRYTAPRVTFGMHNGSDAELAEDPMSSNDKSERAGSRFMETKSGLAMTVERSA